MLLCDYYALNLIATVSGIVVWWEGAANRPLQSPFVKLPVCWKFLPLSEIIYNEDGKNNLT